MPTYTQDTRVGELKTPLGQDVLVLTHFTGTEGVSELFDFHVEAFSSQKGVNFDDAIGKNCTVVLKTIGQGDRYFVGTLTDTQSLDQSVSAEGLTYGYKLTLKPWLWMLSKRSNSLIFPQMTAPDIISKIFSKYGAAAEFENRLEKSYQPIEYCVQHRETDLDFVCRMMEMYGISYHYEFKDDHQKLVLGDSSSSYSNVPGSSRKYIPVSDNYNREIEHLFQWIPNRQFTTGKSTLNDYDFKKPSANLIAEVTGDAKYEQGQLERYEHPGKYITQGDGKTFSTVVNDSIRSADKHVIAAGDCASMAAGSLMTLEDHPDGGQNVEYLVLRCEHTFESEAYRSSSGGSTEEQYRGSYEFVPSSLPFAPPIVTPKPLIAGPQTAKVVGDGEIDCDEHGRIKVHFHWNRESEGAPEGQSMRCRVAQVWAGANWGGIYIPRVGMEVLVQFIDGDPDRPIVIGCVYNGDNKVPYPLPSKKNIAGWKSNSTEGGGGYNEFVMDDTKGNELIRAHAQYNLDSTVENDETRLIKHDRTTTIKNDETMNVTHDIMITADHMLTLKVGASTIVMDQTSITITSPTVSVEAKAEFKSHAGALSSHESDGIFKIQGTMVNIN